MDYVPVEEAQLNELAVKTGRRTDELVQEAVAKLLSNNEWFKQQIQIGVDQIARGEFIEEEEEERDGCSHRAHASVLRRIRWAPAALTI